MRERGSDLLPSSYRCRINDSFILDEDIQNFVLKLEHFYLTRINFHVPRISCVLCNFSLLEVMNSC